jgi:hypothetical protein
VLFPIGLALGAVLIHGLDGAIVFRLIVALILTALGIFVGMMVDARANAQSDHPRYA